ncbi:putative transcription factor MYB family [Helianthus annuus]|uniref:Putative SANT/Myb domain-containing protein n=1 Tax=Helianthus annuus TaxID=4232 RepID=A0A251VFK7_HELAN|nr:trihelix transcription factor GT-2 [Helianthus annuus]KAF5818420.1 putative transcription factor MYB family [Helianthus annuus]KAJ0604711.1 putative transcription factor MYB family [Helianthus annuus]KAJ0618727.1 putative transcription factor MYB family [Helianthus annuus]KAJ0777182.1 putative transcription factor MYB family [Helianthus annuus]KAJ0805355.1 putative transcription factor MYB family [Helianthus annuus]
MDASPATVANSGNDVVSAPSPVVNVGGGGGEDGGSIGGGFTDDGDRSSGGNRWPKQETLALIRIRSEMDAVFRDSNLKGPLWDEVSRKLSELGYHRSGKKCREKFENVYKYHRRTKDGRSMKSDKIYRFSDQLQALESNNRGMFGSPEPLAVKPPPPGFVAMADNGAVRSPFNGTGPDQVQNNVSPISVAAPAVGALPPPPVVNNKRSFPFSTTNMSGSTDSGTSSDSSDDEPPQKKRKWEGFFEKLLKEVIAKQEELQMKFLDTLDRRERDRVAKEEAWRAQEIARMNQEHDRLVKERSIVAAKDAAIVTFLQKLVGKSVDAIPVVLDNEARKKLTDVPEQQIQQTPARQLPPPAQPRETPLPVVSPTAVKTPNGGTGPGENNILSPSPSRWPKAEISTLITLRTQLDAKYQENVPKGPLWEEISAAMRNHGYNRNAKRCKEKWENINKYYKKIKESNKKRPEDAKTCPYFDQLDAIYREKSTAIVVAQPERQWPPPATTTVVVENPPTQQWPVGTNIVHVAKGGSHELTPSATGQKADPPRQPPQSSADMEDQGSEEYDDFDEDDDGDEDKEDEHGVYEIVSSKMSSMAAV